MRRPGRRRAVAAVLSVAALLAAGCTADGAGGSGAARPGAGPGPATEAPGSSTTAGGTTAEGGRALVAAACAGTSVRTVGQPLADASVLEVSGVAPTAGRTWVLNDSGDEPRLYGVDADGAVQVVAVGGADAVDWEDLTVVGSADAPETGERSHLWIADTGDNTRSRTSVQLYRVPVPAAGDAVVTAERVDVTYPDGPHDVEAVAADPTDGALHLLTKLESPTLLFRVEPPAGGGAVAAEALGPVELGGTGIATSLAISPDRGAIAVRTYDGVWLSPLGDDRPVAEALADDGARCRAPSGAELQGEAVGFLPDSRGYVTIGEGAEPTITTFTVPG